MDYNKHYLLLIERAKTRKLDGYLEKHHIVPRCMGGSDELTNLVKLTPEEHYVAHQLLVKIYPENHKVVFAAQMMAAASNTHTRNNKLYGWLRKRLSIALSESNRGIRRSPETEFKKGKFHTGKPFKKGHIPWMKGKRGFISKDGLEKIRESNRRCKKGLGLHRTPDQKKNISAARIGKATGSSNGMSSAENRAKVGASKIGRKWFHNPTTKQVIQVHPDNKPEGFVVGKKVS